MKRLGNPLVYIVRRSTIFHVNTQNASEIANRIICSDEPSNSEVTDYVSKEMRGYPLSNRLKYEEKFPFRARDKEM